MIVESEQKCNPKPTPLPVIFDNIPPHLSKRKKWVFWDYALKDGRWTKVPMRIKPDGTLGYASSTDERTWDYLAPLRKYIEDNPGKVAGVGYVVDGRGNLTGIDLDKCRNPDGTLTESAQADVALIDTYTEYSPSAKGIRMFALGKLPTGWRKQGDRECYESGRFLTITGHRIGTQTDVQGRTEALTAFHSKYAKETIKPKAERVERPSLSMDDAEIIRRCRSAANGSKFARLWDGDASDYRKDSGEPDHSSADLGLVRLIAFFTQDTDQIDRLFRASGLMRAKWDDPRGHQTYGERTIGKALESASEFYTGPQPAPEPERNLKSDWKAGQRSDVTIDDLDADQDDLTGDAKVSDVKPDTGQEPEPERTRPHVPEWIRLQDIATFPDPEWLVKRHFSRENLVIIAGQSGACKSFFALEMGIAIASGVPLWGLYKAKRGKVAYVYSEGATGCKFRMAAWQKHTGRPIPYDFALSPTRHDLSNHVATANLLDRIEQFLDGTPDIIFVDTLNRNFGPGDENSTKDMSAFISGCDILRRHGSAVAVVHHTGRDASRGERGSSALRGAADVMLKVSMTTGKLVRVENDKMKDGTPAVPYLLSQKEYTIGQDADGEPITSIALDYFGTAKEAKDAEAKSGEKPEAEQTPPKTLDALTFPTTAGRAAKSWNVTRQAAEKKLKKYADNGKLTSKPSSVGGPTVYELPA